MADQRKCYFKLNPDKLKCYFKLIPDRPKKCYFKLKPDRLTKMLSQILMNEWINQSNAEMLWRRKKSVKINLPIINKQKCKLCKKKM